MKVDNTDAFTHYAIVNESNPLEELLDEITRTEAVVENGKYVNKPVYNSAHTWFITIEYGYDAMILNRHNGIRCNFYLKGESPNDVDNPQKAKIFIDRNVVNQTVGLGDSILGIRGENYNERIAVGFENIAFMPIGQIPGTEFESSNDTDFEVEAMIVKIYFAKKVTFYKISSFLQNGKISPIDLRTCDNVIVEDCDFTNNNGVMEGNRVGSILMIRGIMHNVTICNNTFTKYGNDEILWIAFSPEPVPKTEGNEYYTTDVPEAERELIFRRNICITNNTFIYKRPQKSDNSGLYPSNAMGVMITFESYPNTYWENVLVANNNIQIEDLVHRVFWVSISEDAREFHSFRFIGNKIRRDYSSIEVDGWSSDFWITGAKTQQSFEAIEIAQNEMIATQTIGDSSSGHVCVYQTGMNVDVHDNIFDGKDFTLVSSAKQQKGFVAFTMESYSGILRFHNNKIVQTAHLGQVLNIPQDEEIELEVLNNFVDGGSRIYFWDSTNVHLRVEGNYFKTSSYALFLLGSPKGGSIRATNNVWETDYYENKGIVPVGYEGVLYDPEPYVTDILLSRVVFTNNVVTGDISNVMTKLPPASITVRNGNHFPSVQSEVTKG